MGSQERYQEDYKLRSVRAIGPETEENCGEMKSLTEVLWDRKAGRRTSCSLVLTKS